MFCKLHYPFCIIDVFILTFYGLSGERENEPSGPEEENDDIAFYAIKKEQQEYLCSM